ncbi:MAG: serine/threonine protein kinase, partial [Lentisphaerae bacterium]|nr:serine/threonine protein kinase [Lentisphaerota bacterium]
MDLYELYRASGASSFENEMLQTYQQISNAFGQVQEGMRNYLRRYCKEHGIRVDVDTEEATFAWLEKGTLPPPDKVDLARLYVETLKTSQPVKQVFSTAMTFFLTPMIAQGGFPEAMRITNNLNELGLPPYTNGMRLPQEKEFIQMAKAFHEASNTMVIPKSSTGFSGDTSRYRIIKEVGRGAFGTVFLAHDNRLRRDVAIKRLSLDRSKKSELDALRIFESEAQAIARMNHPGIIQVYDLEDAPDGYRIVMEYVDGLSLERYLESKGGQLSEEESVNIFKQICKAISHAHGNGIIHRDIKPANILLQQNNGLRVKIGDFGIAVVSTATYARGSATIAGTRLYSAPEQYAPGAILTPAADVY